MQIGEVHCGGQGQAGLVMGGGFAGKADDDVGGDGGVRQGAANQGNGAAVVVGVVAAAHCPQDGVAAALEGDVEVRAEARVLPTGQQVGGDFVGLEG